MYNTVDELTVNYEEEGILQKSRKWIRKCSPRARGPRCCSAIRSGSAETDGYGPDKYTIRRYKKSGGEYRQQSKFTISSADQARRIVAALERWLEDGGNEGLERFAVENGNRSGGRGSGRPRRMSLKTTLFRRNDGSAAFENWTISKAKCSRCPARDGAAAGTVPAPGGFAHGSGTGRFCG